MIERPVRGKGLRRPDSNRRYAAYETAALPLGYSAVGWENGMASRCCPGRARIWSPRRASWRPPCLVIWKMERSAGLAPAFPEWKSGILLLDDDRFLKK